MAKFVALCVFLGLASAAEVHHSKTKSHSKTHLRKTDLRPYAARHQAEAHKAATHHEHPKIATHVASGFQPMGAVAAPPVVAPPVAAAPPPVQVVAPVAEPIPSTIAMPAMPAYEASDTVVAPEPVVHDAPAPQTAALKQLQDDLVEVKQMHTNVVTVEKTLAADVSLLRESALLQRMSRSPKAKAAAEQQVRQTERLVKDTEAMVVKSRHNAMTRAREALEEAREVQKAADALSDEARAQLRVIETKNAASVPAGPTQPAPVAKPADIDDDSTTDDVAM